MVAPQEFTSRDEQSHTMLHSFSIFYMGLVRIASTPQGGLPAPNVGAPSASPGGAEVQAPLKWVQGVGS